MSLIGKTEGTSYEAGYFIADGDETVVRETRQIGQTGATSANGGKYHMAGELYPANDGTVEGFLYEDVDVTDGDAPCSVVTSGCKIVEDYIPLKPSEMAASALEALGAKGFTFVEAASVTRPY